MDKAGKEEILGEIKEAFANVQSVVLADYRGITVPVVTAIRDDFRKAGCHYRVLKNSLVKIAIKGSRMEPMTVHLAGPTAVSGSRFWAAGLFSDRTCMSMPASSISRSRSSPTSFSLRCRGLSGGLRKAKSFGEVKCSSMAITLASAI